MILTICLEVFAGIRGQKRVSNDGELGIRKFVFPGAVKLNLYQPWFFLKLWLGKEM